MSQRYLGMKLLCCRIALWMKAVFSPPIHLCCSWRHEAANPTPCNPPPSLHDPALLMCVSHISSGLMAEGCTCLRQVRVCRLINGEGSRWPCSSLSVCLLYIGLQEPCSVAPVIPLSSPAEKQPRPHTSTLVSLREELASLTVYNVVCLSPSQPLLLFLIIYDQGASRKPLVQ